MNILFAQNAVSNLQRTWSSVANGKMNKIKNLVKALLTNGKDDQAFIGAAWLVALLRLTPRPLKRKMALRILALSPHYFYRTSRPEYKNMPTGQFLEAEYERNRTSRERICNQILLPNLKPGITVLDIGCGPGFLAKAVSRHVKLIYACDISKGVMACAGVINGAPNIRFIYSGESGFARVPDASLDLAYTFAVIQHVRESIIRSLFLTTGKKMRSGGRCLFQVQLDNGKWEQESDWAADQSVAGKLRLKYAMNFFPRTEEFFRKLAAEAGFSVVEIRPVSELLDEPFDDVYYQHLLILAKI
jgi:SAM-dependent methyltransferase